ncbi:3-deoxy-D-manno-octulosonic-acid transferase [Pseudosulfitobacter pseudonitzschiae]|uniref:3-deoxy-D-manno-octulosonic acid transferase n=1 Tax=Pseudosulfitobacter pseudonitzschiae TaxID=1402135 RepID=A0A073J3S7_9RHOB|nr:glycosyltransferase N-terminal domain-containing protein [Pseudosulfitobacter pseudonitzschiae]KEJ97268.1 3-deoxy-D-manno-octulosonic acid transferase [Pseudosulfitobacter pseudonitzschiae]QKS10319.1 3-deoxy-D-manno-octulosonic acid transferase [Pseudosulfitobacter pseudonitzschiae]SHF55616.1 3-deoxy-D-manno-octulosonic-acid transferase [Pseudosulfitobacter pseudonitzschiae]
MARSLGFAAYRALTRRGPVPKLPDYVPRPNGELVWLHAAEPGSEVRVRDLARRLIAARFGLHVLLTAPTEPAACDDPCLLTAALPPEHPAATAAFAAHWKPDAVIWTWGALQPNLVEAAAALGHPMFLIDAGADGFDTRRDRWLTEVPRQLLALFDKVLARSDAAEARVRQLGVPEAKIDRTAPLVSGGQALPASPQDVDDLSQALSGRPVWFASGVTAAEVSAVLTAHRRAQRLSHRLLLILNPRDAAADAFAANLCVLDALRMVRWSDGTYPDDNTAVLLADLPDESGLWFRVAPVSFLGGSLETGQGGQDPFAAAALGSAVLYGPSVGKHLDAYRRLANAGAARIVNDAESLGAAVTWLIAPDQAAKMAMAGWDVVTEGADTVERIITLLNDSLDARQDGLN